MSWRDRGSDKGGHDDGTPADEVDLALAEQELAATAANGSAATNGKHLNAFQRLYRGETRFDFVGRKRIWFTISLVIIIAGLLSIGIRGLNLGIDFKGGTSWEVVAPGVTQAQATSAVVAAGLNQPTVEILGGRTVEVQADLNALPQDQQNKVTAEVTHAMQELAHGQTVSITSVGPTWGGEVTKRALIALIAFLAMVVLYISFRFEPKMAAAAFIAMIHDLLITLGIYSLANFQVTPDTVIAVLTILGYSLYDTVVVFDRVRDNAKGIGSTGRMTYSEMVNLSMNQTLARSINTSLVAIMPVLSVLVIGAEILGATTLQNYGLALFIGLLSGAYSSIFIASPVLAMMKEREPRYIAIRQRIESRKDRTGLLTPAAAALLVGAAAGGSGSARAGGSSRPARAGTIRPGGAARPSGSTRGRPPARTSTSGGATSSKGTASNKGTASSGAAGTSGDGAGPAAGTTSTTKASGTSGGRPAPRPRKGGGKSKSKRRR
jgi:preprotein translocase subunit SecF